MTAEANPGPIAGYTAGADLSASQWRLVKGGSADNTVVAATDATAPILGVITFPAGSGKTVSVQHYGVAKVEAGGAITRFTLVTAGTGGKAAAYSAPGAGVTNYAIGIALEAAAADGEFIRVLLIPNVNTGT